jgi:plasmid stabilization system protein ParE
LARIIRSDPASEDLDGVWDYLAVESSPEIADIVVARLTKQCIAPPTIPIPTGSAPNFAASPGASMSEYAIFYEPLPEGDGIFVLRIIHGRRDLR